MWKYFLFGDIEYQMYFSSNKSFLPDLSGKKEWKLEWTRKKIKINKKKPPFIFICFLQDHQWNRKRIWLHWNFNSFGFCAILSTLNFFFWNPFIIFLLVVYIAKLWNTQIQLPLSSCLSNMRLQYKIAISHILNF